MILTKQLLLSTDSNIGRIHRCAYLFWRDFSSCTAI